MGTAIKDQWGNTTAIPSPFRRTLLDQLRDDLHEAEKDERRAMMRLGMVAVVNGLDHPATIAARREAIDAQRQVIEAGAACHEQYEREAVEGSW